MWRFSYRFLKACLLSPVLLCIECKSFHSVLLLQQKIKCHQMAWVDTFKDLDGSFGSRNVILACLVSLAFSKMCPRYQSYTLHNNSNIANIVFIINLLNSITNFLNNGISAGRKPFCLNTYFVEWLESTSTLR